MIWACLWLLLEYCHTMMPQTHHVPLPFNRMRTSASHDNEGCPVPHNCQERQRGNGGNGHVESVPNCFGKIGSRDVESCLEIDEACCWIWDATTREHMKNIKT